MKKSMMSLTVILAFTMLAGCGSGISTPAGLKAPNAAANITVAETAAPAEAAENTDSTETATADAFKTGTWYSVDDNGLYGVYYFYQAEDGTPSVGITYSNNGIGVPAVYEVQGDKVIFHMGSVDNITEADLAKTDDENVTLTWNAENGTRTETLTYSGDYEPEFGITEYEIKDENGNTLVKADDNNIALQQAYKDVSVVAPSEEDVEKVYSDENVNVYQNEKTYYIVDMEKNLYTIVNK